MTRVTSTIIIADIYRKELRIPKCIKRKLHILASAEATLYFEYKRRYPDFKEVIVNSLGYIYEDDKYLYHTM